MNAKYPKNEDFTNLGIWHVPQLNHLSNALALKERNNAA
jgi:hypothetical protein